MRLLLLLLAALLPLAANAADMSPTSPAEADEYTTVTLQGLNKVTGHIVTLTGPVGTLLRFGTLAIVAHHCWQSPPDEQPENAAQLDISELKPGEPPKRIFLGWMFSSSPGLSGLEDPVYDVTVLSCGSEPIEKPVKKSGRKKS